MLEAMFVFLFAVMSMICSCVLLVAWVAKDGWLPKFQYGTLLMFVICAPWLFVLTQGERPSLLQFCELAVSGNLIVMGCTLLELMLRENPKPWRE